jgi:hypothetical protein
MILMTRLGHPRAPVARLYPTSLDERGPARARRELVRRGTGPRRRNMRYRWRHVLRTSYDFKMARFETAPSRADHDAYGRVSRGQE